MRKIFPKFAALSVGLAMAMGAGVALGQLNEPVEVGAVAASIVEGTNASSVTVNDKSAIKIGTAKKVGTATIGVVKDTVSLSFYAAGWNSENSASLTLSASVGTITPATKALTKATALSGTATAFDIDNESTYFCEFTLSGVTANSTITITATSTEKRAVVWGASYELDGAATKYTVTDSLANATVNVSQVTEGSTLNATITPDNFYELPASVSVTMGGTPVDFTYEDGVVTVQNVTGNVEISGAAVATPVEALSNLYSKEKGARIVVLGKVIGSYDSTYTGVYIGNGDYAGALYGFSDFEYDVDKVYKFAGTIDEFNRLRQLKDIVAVSASAEEIEEYYSAPKDYVATGEEDSLNVTSRLTIVRGKVKSLSGTIASGSDTTVVLTLDNENDINIFIKKNQPNSINYNALKTALVVNETVTIKGVLSVRSTGESLKASDFQLILPKLVEVDPGVTALSFANALLNATNGPEGICAHPAADRADELVALWSDLNENYYAKMSAEERQIIADAVANYDNDSENPIENAMGRYDYLTKKYSLTNFLGRDLSGVVVNTLAREDRMSTEKGNTALIVAAVVAAASLAAGATIFLLRKKRKQN